ncbi:MAG: GTP 3',8-cyclase MoaA [Ilumatobacteraceae bacterium]|jgi:cyclic pyranopterin phosphate synthase
MSQSPQQPRSAAAKPELIDSFGRTVRDLRISVTDRCNFRCTYCMPEEGMQWLPRTDVLTYEEIVRVARICVERFGVDGIRLTGGEPTVRAHLPVLIEKLAALTVPADADSPRAGRPIDLALTTNGATLALVAHDLKRAGLARINVSLDTLDREKFQRMTKRDELDSVLEGIAVAQEVGFAPVKVNAVVQRGVNDDEILALATFGRDNDIEVRFIEFMPLDAQGGWLNDSVVGQDEIVSTIHHTYPLEQLPSRGAAPADRWRYLDGRGTVGVIPTVTKPFCGDCDRVRLTADGQFRTCLFATDEFDVRALLRGGDRDDAGSEGATDDAIEALLRRAVGEKWAGHNIGQVSFVRPRRSMSQIGG